MKTSKSLLRILTLTALLAFSNIELMAQGINILAVKGKPCADRKMMIVFDVFGTFNATNHFIVEMDTNNFIGSSIIKLDSILSLKPGKDSMSVKIPNFANKSAKYRFRVVSTSPKISGAMNGNDIRISNYSKPASPPAPVVTKASCPKAKDGSVVVNAVPGYFGPLNFMWMPAVPPIPPIPNPQGMAPGMYYVRITDDNGCDTILPVSVGTINTVNASVGGNIKLGGNGITKGKVFLLPRDSAKKIKLDTIVDVNASGVYSITNRAPGKYIVFAKADSLLYPTSIGTYTGNTHRWDSAQVILLQCNNTVPAQVNLINLPPMTGECIIKGTVLEGNGFQKGPGDPIGSVEIGLEIFPPGGSMTAQSVTDANGAFEFKNVDAGGYKLHVEIPGLTEASTFNINVSSQDSAYTDLNFIADSAKIYTDLSTSIKQLKGSNNSIRGMVYDPVSGEFILKYSLDKAAKVSIILHDVSGKKVFETSFSRGKGEQQEKFSADLTSGIYILEISYGDEVYRSKMLLPEAIR